MKSKLIILPALVLILSMVLLGVSDSSASGANAGIPGAGMPDAQRFKIEEANNKGEAKGPPSSSATITITMTTCGEPGELVGPESVGE